MLEARVATILDAIGTTKLIEMFDLLPNTLFWIKDIESCFLHANQQFVEHSKLGCLSRLIGQNDFAISPPYLARQYMLDDKKVMAGETVTDRIELNHLQDGKFGWFATTKRRLISHDDELYGTYGFTQFLEQSSPALTRIAPVRAPVEYVREHYNQAINVETLAEIACLSISALERRFKKYLGKTPKQFINEIRLQNARRLLIETKLPILDVAYQCGFTDHSYFSKQFKAKFGLMPSELREQFESALTNR